jgi:cytoskeleton protein RodZ
VSDNEEMVRETVVGPSVGERLRAAREGQGLEIEEIASRTRIPTRHLTMIERGDYSELPAPTYSAGFIKTYARLLGLDGQALATEFREEIGSTRTQAYQPEPYEPADPRRTPPPGLALLAVIVAMIVGLGYLYWRGSSEQPAEIAATSSELPAAPVSQAAPAPAAAQSPAAASPSATGPVAIAATEDVWVKVSDGSKTLFMGVLKPGSRFDVPAEAAEPLLTTGRPGVTTIMVGQTTIPPVGDPDRVAKGISLKADALLARAAGSNGAGGAANGAALPSASGV